MFVVAGLQLRKIHRLHKHDRNQMIVIKRRGRDGGEEHNEAAEFLSQQFRCVLLICQWLNIEFRSTHVKLYGFFFVMEKGVAFDLVLFHTDK